MKNSINIFILMLYFIGHSQGDTLSFENILIEQQYNGVQNIYTIDKELFTGYLKGQKHFDSICHIHVVDGKFISEKCNFIGKVQEYKFFLSNYDEKEILKNDDISLINKPLKNDQPSSIETNPLVSRYYVKEELYSGYTKNRDTTNFYFEGELKFSKIFSKNKLKTYLEYNLDDIIVYEEYNKEGENIVRGSFRNGLKNGKWKYKNLKNYDEITFNYLDGNLEGVVVYHNKGKIVKEEIFKNNKIIYKCEYNYRKNIEKRTYYKNSKKENIEYNLGFGFKSHLIDLESIIW